MERLVREGEPVETAPANPPPKLHPKAAAISQAKRGERLTRYQQVVALRKLGFSMPAIAQSEGNLATTSVTTTCSIPCKKP